MSDLIVISDDDVAEQSNDRRNRRDQYEIKSFQNEELINPRPGVISTFASLLENDESNVPDEKGQVVINPTRQKNELPIYLARHIGVQLKPHQISGIRFMFSNLINSVGQFNAGFPGSGCILAHSMGLGKTLQVVALMEALFRCTKIGKCLIVAPANTIRLWYAEFNKWLPEKPKDFSSKGLRSCNALEINEDDRFRSFPLNFLDDECKTFEDKVAAISDWNENGGVFLIGYEMMLALWKNANRRFNVCARTANEGDINCEGTLYRRRKEDLETISSGFFNPDIIVFDEGHRLKSESGEVVQLIQRVKTRRRLVLTGYPLQNNLVEYRYMVDFIRPDHYLGPLIQFKDLFVYPIQRGSANDSVPAEVALMRDRTHILYSLLKGFVHRRPALLLYQHLPPKYEYILSLKLTPFQCRLYNEAVSKCSMTGGLCPKNLFRAFALSMKVSNHPDVFCKFVQSRIQENNDNESTEWSGEEDIVDDQPSTSKKTPTRRGKEASAKIESSLSTMSQSSEWAEWLAVAKRAGFQEEALENSNHYGHDMKWALPLLDGYSPECKIEDSPKFRVLMCLIKHAILAGDRMLIFSQNLPTLDLLEKMLKKSIKPHASSMDDHEKNYWQANVDYYRFDGSTPGSSRELLIKRFQQSSGSNTIKAENYENEDSGESTDNKPGIGDNDDCKIVGDLSSSQARLFLISTRAGSLGITLTGANRVCLLDASWNPCQDVQALSRVYRFGQRKTCFVYRLVSDCSLERVVYDRQVQKEALSTRVVDDSPVNRKFSRDEIRDIFRRYPEDHTVPEEPPPDSKDQAAALIAAVNAPVEDSVLNSVLKELAFLFSRPPQRHDTFREIDPAQRLSAEERRRALLQYEVDKEEYEKNILPAFSKRLKKRRPSEEALGRRTEVSPLKKQNVAPSSAPTTPAQRTVVNRPKPKSILPSLMAAAKRATAQSISHSSELNAATSPYLSSPSSSSWSNSAVKSQKSTPLRSSRFAVESAEPSPLDLPLYSLPDEPPEPSSLPSSTIALSEKPGVTRAPLHYTSEVITISDDDDDAD